MDPIGEVYRKAQAARQLEYERALEAEEKVRKLRAAMLRFLSADHRATIIARRILHDALAETED